MVLSDGYRELMGMEAGGNGGTSWGGGGSLGKRLGLK